MREALEGEDLQARVAVERIIGEQLAFELKRGLFGREQDQRWSFGSGGKGSADFRQAAEGFAAAGGTEEKTRLHDLFSRKGAKAQRNLL